MHCQRIQRSVTSGVTSACAITYTSIKKVEMFPVQNTNIHYNLISSRAFCEKLVRGSTTTVPISVAK